MQAAANISGAIFYFLLLNSNSGFSAMMPLSDVVNRMEKSSFDLSIFIYQISLFLLSVIGAIRHKKLSIKNL
jgi:hypothetical protein